MKTSKLDSITAWLFGLKLIDIRGREEAKGVFTAEHAGLRVMLDTARAPMLLTIDAPGRVLEFEMDDLEGTNAKALSYVAGRWQQKLFKTISGNLPWRDRSWFTAPFSRRPGWPFGQTGGNPFVNLSPGTE